AGAAHLAVPRPRAGAATGARTVVGGVAALLEDGTEELTGVVVPLLATAARTGVVVAVLAARRAVVTDGDGQQGSRGLPQVVRGAVEDLPVEVQPAGGEIGRASCRERRAAPVAA